MKRTEREYHCAGKECATKSSFSWRQTINLIAITVLATLLMLAHSNVNAAGYHLIVNGKTIHKEQPKKGSFNEKNWGLGLQYDYSIYKKRWLPYLTISGFKDSYNENSFYAGGGMMRRFSLDWLQDELHFDAGLVVFVMTRKDHRNGRPFLGALPAFSLGSDRVAVNISYVPKVAPKLVPLWFFQLKIAFDNFN